MRHRDTNTCPRTAGRLARRSRCRWRRATQVGAGALLLAAVALAGGSSPLPGQQPAGGGTAAAAAAHPAQDSSDPGASVPLGEREICDDGSDPAASLRPSDRTGDAVRRIQERGERGELIVGVDQTSYLWGFREPETNKLIGFDIDLVHAIAEDLLGDDPQIVFKAIPTSERVPLLRDRKIDMVVRSMSITCERRDEVAFSAAYFETGQQLLAPRRSAVEGFDESLDGQRVCSAEGSTAQILLRERGTELGAKLVTAGNHLDCLVLVQLGEADALMSDGALAAGHSAQDPAVRLVGGSLTMESYGVAMHQEDEDLVRRVNHVLEDFTRGGDNSDWADSYQNWLAGHLETAAPSPPEPMYRD